MNDEVPQQGDPSTPLTSAAEKLAAVAERLDAVVARMEQATPKPITAPDGTVASPQVMESVEQAEQTRTMQSIESIVQRILDGMEERS